MRRFQVSEIDINEFRGIRACERPLKLSKFNVLIGKNNSGKTALLEALYLFPDPHLPTIPSFLLPAVELQNLKWVPADCRLDLVEKRHSGWNSLVFGYIGTAQLKYSVEGTNWSVAIDADDRKARISIGNDDRIISTNDIVNALKLPETELKKISILLLNDDSILKNIYRFLDPLEDFFAKQGDNIEIATFVNDCVDDVFTEIQWKKEGLCARCVLPDGRTQFIRIDDFGEGIKRAIVNMLLLRYLSPNLVLWDDFGSNEHPKLINKQLAWLLNQDWQVVLSTHSIDVLHELVMIGIEEVNVIQMRKTEAGILVHETLNLEQLEQILNGTDPRIIAGSLGL